MTAEQKHITLLEEAEKSLRQLPPESIKVAIAFLAYLHKTEESKVIEELLSIPGFAVSFRESVENNNSNDILGNNSLDLAQDAEVWEAYLTSKKKWKEVYRRLANS